MKITTFTATEPFDVERNSEDDMSKDPVRIGVAVGWGLTSAGFAVPVFANAAVALNHGDRAVMGKTKMVIGFAEKSGEAIFDAGTPEVQSGPGRPPKPKTEPVKMGPWDIGFSDKSYRLISSWEFRDGNTNFVFQIPGEKDVPDDPRVTKINRTEFNNLSKGDLPLPIKTYEEVLGIVAPGSGISESSEEESEDEDALDLV